MGVMMRVTLGSETAHGFVQHLRVWLGDRCVDAPVKLRPATERERARNGLAVGFGGLPYPVYDNDGRRVYVLPGGAEIAA